MMVNKRLVREYMLRLSKETRGGKFTRVSEEFYPKAEAMLMAACRSYIHSLPSVGKTIK